MEHEVDGIAGFFIDVAEEVVDVVTDEVAAEKLSFLA